MEILRDIILAGDGAATNTLAYDANDDKLIATGTTVPANATTGFAKGCLFIKTNAATGVRGLYENLGTATSCIFNLVGGTADAAQVMTPGAGISAGVGTVYKSSIVKQGDIFKTTIFLDLTGLASSTTDLDIIGTAGICHLGQITAAKNGTIFYGQVTCLETPATGADDVIFYSATEGTGAFDAAIGGLTGTVLYDKTSAAAGAAATQIALAALPAANSYLYLANGESGTAGTYTAGQFLLEFWGA